MTINTFLQEKFMELVDAKGELSPGVKLQLKTMSGGANTGSNLLRLGVNPKLNFSTENQYKKGISTYYNINGDSNGISNAKVSLCRLSEPKKNGLMLNACYSKSSDISITNQKINEFVLENGIGSYFFDNDAQENGVNADFNVIYRGRKGAVNIGISSLITNNNILDIVNNSGTSLISTGKDEVLGTFYTFGYATQTLNRLPFLYGISYDLGKLDSNTDTIGNRIDLNTWNIFLKRNYNYYYLFGNMNVESTLSYRRGDIDYEVTGVDSSFYKIGLLLQLGENIDLGYSRYKSSNLATANTKINTIFAGFSIKGFNLEFKSQNLSNINRIGNKEVLSLSSSFSF